MFLDHEYVVYEILNCDNDNLEEGDPECADEDELREWLSNKAVHYRIINQQIDFTDRDTFAV